MNFSGTADCLEGQSTITENNNGLELKLIKTL
jgi:hypothetical protein